MNHGIRTGKSSAKTNWILGILLVVFAVLLALAVHESLSIGPSATQPADIAAIGAATGAVLICFVTRSSRAKRTLLFVLYILAVVEIVFQALAIVDLLPRVNTYSRVPYGRVYWTREGHANATMNRFGWYYPAFPLEEGSQRIALIGDSMIQGIQVRRDDNAGVVLEDLLHLGALPQAEVLALGLSGAGPAHYLELLRYVVKHFHPDEAILCIFIGNDFLNVYRDTDTPIDPRDRSLYYFIDERGILRLHAGSVLACRTLHRLLAYNHRSLFINSFRIAKSHYFTRSVLSQAIEGISRRDERAVPEGENRIDAGLQSLGLDDFIFKKKLDAPGFAALDIVTGLLKRCNRIASSNGITLRIVTIPVFPSFFFERFRSAGWSLETDEYDFLLPEKILTDFAHENGIPILPLGNYMYETGLTAERIGGLFFHGGRGHFTPAGHRYVAEAIYTSFYAQDPGYAEAR